MTQKKYQVFISSTYTDLVEERKKVQEILLMADCIPAGMEAFVAANDEQFEVIKKVIDLCDYYVLIIGKRYGSINQSTGLSYTEMEYDYAVSQGIPVLVFAIDDSVKLSQDKKENNEDIKYKLNAFKTKAMKNRLASMWKTQSDLAGEVAVSIMKAKQEIVRPGWIRGGDFDPEKDLKKINTLQENNKQLLDKNAELQHLVDEFYKFDEDLEYDENELEVEYVDVMGGDHIKKILIKDIFAYVSLFLPFEPFFEEELMDLIREAVSGNKNSYFTDAVFCKRICVQFVSLNLLDCYLGNGGRKVLYKLSRKGIKFRETLNTFKKRLNCIKENEENK